MSIIFLTLTTPIDVVVGAGATTIVADATGTN